MLHAVLEEELGQLVAQFFARLLGFEALVICVHAGYADHRYSPVEHFDDVLLGEDIAGGLHDQLDAITVLSP